MNLALPPSWPALLMVLALAGCSESQPTEESSLPVIRVDESAAAVSNNVTPPPGVADTAAARRLACAAECSEDDGYLWATQEGVTNPELCGGPLPFMEGCRRYAFEHEDGHDLTR